MSRMNRRSVIVFALTIGVMVIAGGAFVYKMGEFATTIVKDDIAGFGAVAVTTYLIGMLPIVLVTMWAVLSGKFRDVERPKFRMLELNDEIERQSAARAGRRG
ncbi:MAG TPA: hypothetical protein VEI94_03110 [Candidatus Bathyarchaeia archaeon]|nr:hypothetical protein [Candidatus Bathyarchaeia archaeon]